MKRFQKRITQSVFFAGALAFGAAAHASPITVQLHFPENLDVFPDRFYEATKITYDYTSGTLSMTETATVAAGMFSGTASNGEGIEISTLFRNEFDVLAYCIDILNDLLPSGEYTVKQIAPNDSDETDGARRDFGQMLDFLGAANHVARGMAGFSDQGDKNWLNPNSKSMAAAIQVGIWETLYETLDYNVDSFSVSTGDFQAENLSDDAIDFLYASFRAMNSTNALDANQVRWMQIEDGQDLIVDPVDVPAPAPLLLLAAGLGLLSLRRRVSAAV